MFYEVERSKDTVIVAVIKHKVDGKFSEVIECDSSES